MAHQLPPDPSQRLRQRSRSPHKPNGGFRSRDIEHWRRFGNERSENTADAVSLYNDPMTESFSSSAVQQNHRPVPPTHHSSSLSSWSASAESSYHSEEREYTKHRSCKSSSESDSSRFSDLSHWQQRHRHHHSESQKRPPKPLPLIHFPPDHPYYQGPPPSSGELSPQFRSTSNSVCAGCGGELALSKVVLKALGEKYHPDCFQCAHCGLSLEHAAFFPHEGKVYCHLDYHEMFSPRCDHCHTPIEGEVVNAMGKTYHFGHFFCAGCSEPFSMMPSASYHARDNHAWCHDCFTKRYSTKCWKCTEIIPEGDVIIKVLGREWCSSCFACEECTTPFGDDGFVLRDDGTLVCMTCEELRLKRNVYSL
ncbi:hypothetical protein BZA70DRAFT_275190 [Myxozyma melibiosi]|uniref:LIM zinc-binding domain-containing protein n=1 Tax=Myxozyma melibiosi TaxID=54550 RepID=A0ABR1FAG3_9ASCO